MPNQSQRTTPHPLGWGWCGGQWRGARRSSSRGRIRPSLPQVRRTHARRLSSPRVGAPTVRLFVWHHSAFFCTLLPPAHGFISSYPLYISSRIRCRVAAYSASVINPFAKYRSRRRRRAGTPSVRGTCEEGLSADPDATRATEGNTAAPVPIAGIAATACRRTSSFSW